MQLLEGDSINLEQPNSKTRRGRVGKQIANTLTCSCNQGVVIEVNELIQVGSLDGKHEQSNRVYSEEGICPTIMAGERKTCTGGYVSPKIMVKEKDIKLDNNSLIVVGNTVPSEHTAGRIFDVDRLSPTVMYRNSKVVQILDNKGVDNIWNNSLEKFNFEMEEIRVFDIFAGIGALHQSLKELGVPTRITNLSEIDIDATISYASGHIENFKELEFEYPTDQEMREWLINRNIGYSFEKGKSSVPRMKKDKLKLAYKASYLLNNLGDISKIKYDKIEDFDLMNMSFPCTDISGAGKQRGMKNEDGTPTRSGLYVYSINAVRSKKPKYVMIENVKALIQKKFIDDFYSIIDELEEIGYNCYYPTKQDKKGNKIPTCLNAKDFGIPQNRERIFVIAIRKDVDTKTFEFPVGRDHGVRLKDVLEDKVDKKYYLSDEIQKRFKLNGKDDVNHNELNVVGSSAPECRTIGQRDITYGINGAIRGRYNEDGKIEQQLELRGDGVTNTLTTVEKDNVIVENNVVNRIGGCFDSGNGIAPTMETRNRGKYMNGNNFKIRKLTPLECIRLMGFPDHFYYNAAECNISDSQLYKQAGNSIVVNCLYYIFKNLFKEYIVK